MIKKFLLIIALFMITLFSASAKDRVNIKHIDNNIEIISINFPSTLYFYNSKSNDLRIKVEGTKNENIIYNELIYNIKGNELTISLENYSDKENTRFIDSTLIKIYIPIQYLEKTGTNGRKYISFKKNDSGNSTY